MAEPVGIDFGTTSCVVARLIEEPTRCSVAVVPSRFGEDKTPSAVAVDRSGAWLFGRAAREADAPDKVLSVKRRLGGDERLDLAGRSLPPEFLAAALFRHLALESERRLGWPLTAAVITVPANSKGLQRNATRAAAAAAGIRPLNLINEPTAAAMAYGLGRAAARADLRLLVYDFGGGTFDVTVLRAHHGIFEELASRGLHHCGGDDLDSALADRLLAGPLSGAAGRLDEYARLRLRLACEQAKIALSERDAARLDLEDLAPGLSLHEVLARAELEQLAAPLIERTAAPVREALAEAGLSPRELDHVLLVGGSSRIPAVRRFVEELLGREAEPFGPLDPLTCVAAGAAIVAGILQRAPHTDELDYQVCLEHSLCTEPVDPLTGRRFLEPVIEHGTKIPSRQRRIYFPVADHAAEVLVRICEGNVYDRPADEENVRLGEVRVPLDPPRPSDDCPIAVEFAYSEDGILTAVATDLRQERTFQEVIGYRAGRLETADRAALAEFLTTVFGAPPPVVDECAAAERPAEPESAESRQVRAARRRLAVARAVLIKVTDEEETAELRDLSDQLASAVDDDLPNERIADLDRRLAAELMFFDYLL